MYGSRGHPDSGAGDRADAAEQAFWQSNIANEQKRMHIAQGANIISSSQISACHLPLIPPHPALVLRRPASAVVYRLRLQLAVAYLLVGATHAATKAHFSDRNMSR